MNREPECYGKMFPSVIAMAPSKAAAGKVFGYQLDYSGQVAQKKDTTVDREAWERCLECCDLDGCYRLSTGTMLMELAVKSSPQSLYQGI
jgi:hypothetical protein